MSAPSGLRRWDATAAVVRSNTFSGGRGGTGIVDEESSGTSVTDNTMKGIGAGIGSADSSNGTVSSNKGTTIAYGIYTIDSTDYSLTDNQFNASQYGIETDCPVGELLKGNTTNHNSEAGVFIYTGNECKNGTGTYSETLDNNTGNDNRFGLYSQVATSGRANKATGNSVVNCYQVNCTTGGARQGAPALSPGPPVIPPTSTVGAVKY